MTNETRPAPGEAREPFQAQTIDHVPALLEKSYALRYQVYCLERKFLRAENHVGGLEIDEFDRHAVHVGAIDVHGELAGTARAVKVSELGLPLFRHCTIFPREMDRRPEHASVVEVGRLAVSRSYRRRGDDPACLGETNSPSGRAARIRYAEKRRGGADVLVTVLKALYQATKRIGATEWLAAMEPSLERLLARQGFPFRVLGPESDYFGLVAPYQLDLNEFDGVIMSGRYSMLDDFARGLEERFAPQPGEDQPDVTMPAAAGHIGSIHDSGANRLDGQTQTFEDQAEARLVRKLHRMADK